jgi:type VI secretion system protein ImpC
MLMRLPYDKTANVAGDFSCDEGVDGSDHARYLWGNSAYAFASRLISAFARFGWTAAISGVSNGGIVEHLPTHVFVTNDGDIAMKCPTEVTISDHRERELALLGFIPLIHCKGTTMRVFSVVTLCGGIGRNERETEDACGCHSRF